MDPKLIEAIESLSNPHWTVYITLSVTTFGLGFVAWQVWVANKAIRVASDTAKLASETASANFVLQLQSEFTDHLTETYSNFLPNSAWDPDQPGPTDAKQVAQLERYLDFFANLQILVKKGFLDLDLVDQMFAYRLFIAVNNPHTIRLVNRNREFWVNLIALCRDLAAFRGERTMPNSKYSALIVVQPAGPSIESKLHAS